MHVRRLARILAIGFTLEVVVCSLALRSCAKPVDAGDGPSVGADR